MALESGSYIYDLVQANPPAGDQRKEGDDHLRLIKKVVQQTFPHITGPNLPTSTGTAAAQVITHLFGPAAYIQGMVVAWIAGFTSTGPMTLAVNGLGPRNIFMAGAPIAAGNITAGSLVVAIYDGVQFQVFASTGIGGYLPITGGTLTGNLTAVAINATNSFNCTVPNGGNALYYSQVTGTRQWYAGCISNGSYWINDVTAGAGARLIIDLAGNTTVAQSLAVGGNLTVTGGTTITAGLTVGSNLTVSAPADFNSTIGVHATSGSDNALYRFYAAGNVSKGYIGWLNSAPNALVWQNVIAAQALNLQADGSFYYSGGGGAAIKTGGGSWAAVSDERIKNVLGNYTSSLDKVLQLRPITYTYKGNDTQAKDLPSPHQSVAEEARPYVGLVAQELEKVFPEMVDAVEGFIDGEPVADLRRVDTSALVYALVNAVKELSAKVVALEAKVNA
jgi:Chaperone of endosialidase